MKYLVELMNDKKVCEAFSIIENLACTMRGRIASTDSKVDQKLKETGEKILPYLKDLKRQYEFNLELEKNTKKIGA